MEKIKLLEVEYNKYREWGYNKYNALKQAVDGVFSELTVQPHIYSDSYNEPTQVFYKEYVFIVDNGIYKKL